MEDQYSGIIAPHTWDAIVNEKNSISIAGILLLPKDDNSLIDGIRQSEWPPKFSELTPFIKSSVSILDRESKIYVSVWPNGKAV